MSTEKKNSSKPLESPQTKHFIWKTMYVESEALIIDSHQGPRVELGHLILQ